MFKSQIIPNIHRTTQTWIRNSHLNSVTENFVNLSDQNRIDIRDTKGHTDLLFNISREIQECSIRSHPPDIKKRQSLFLILRGYHCPSVIQSRYFSFQACAQKIIIHLILYSAVVLVSISQRFESLL